MSVRETLLLTGGAGYIGSILTPALLAAGYDVTVLDNFLFGQTTLLDCCVHPDFSVIRGDCRDKRVLQAAMRGKDIIIPLAALVGAPLCERDAFAARCTNLNAIRLLLSLRSHDQRILFPTTNSGYGIGQPGCYCTEDTPPRPLSLYATTKVEAERAVLEAGYAITFRLATVFGMSPRMRIDLLVNDFVYRAVTDRALIVFEGHCRRNFIHVRDVARVFLWGLEHFERMKDEPYNVGLSDANLSKLELCARIKRHIPAFVYVEADAGEDPDKRDYIVSNERLYRTGFRPEYSLDMGICELIKGYNVVHDSKYANT